MQKLDKNIVHDIGNYLHQIISNAQYMEDNGVLSDYAKKIKNSAYSIDALITDSAVKKPNIDLNKNSKIMTNFSRFRNLNVLIVDDLVENIHIMTNIFKTLSCNIFTARSGEEAIKLYQNGCKPDIVSMDMIMSGIDGVTTTLELKKLGCEAYFIAISALKNQTNEVVSLFDCWLSKPFTSGQMNCALSGYNAKTVKLIKSEVFKLTDDIQIETQNDILYLAQNGAYSELERVINTLPNSKSKEFLSLSLKKINFTSIIESIENKMKGV